MFKLDGESLLISPPEELVIQRVSEFHEQLKQELSKENFKSIVLDLIGVINIDTAGFQTLVALKNEAKKKGLVLMVVGMSVEVDEMITLYNAQQFFEG